MSDKSDPAAAKPIVSRLAGSDWGKMGTGIGAIVLAAAGWANSMKTGLDTALFKLDAAAERMTSIERKFDKIEDRLLKVELSQIRRAGKAPPSDDPNE